MASTEAISTQWCLFVSRIAKYNCRKVISVSAERFVICAFVTSCFVLTAENAQEIKTEEKEPLKWDTSSHMRAESLWVDTNNSA